jgi:hypothetical protein
MAAVAREADVAGMLVHAASVEGERFGEAEEGVAGAGGGEEEIGGGGVLCESEIGGDDGVGFIGQGGESFAGRTEGFGRLGPDGGECETS